MECIPFSQFESTVIKMFEMFEMFEVVEVAGVAMAGEKVGVGEMVEVAGNNLR
jgi:hypothetical protein